MAGKPPQVFDVFVPPGMDLSAIIDGIEFLSTGSADKVIQSAKKYNGRVRFHPDADSKRGEGYAYVQDLMMVIPMHIIACVIRKEFVLDADTGNNVTNVTYMTFKSRSRHEYLARCLRSLQVVLVSHGDLFLPTEVSRMVLDMVALILTEMLGPDHNSALSVASAEIQRGQASVDWCLREAVIRADIIGACLELLRDSVVVARHMKGEDEEALASLRACEAILVHPRSEVLLDAACDALGLVAEMTRRVLDVEADQEARTGAAQGGQQPTNRKDGLIGTYMSHDLAARVARGADILGALTAHPLMYNGMLMQEEPGQAVCRLVQAALRLQRRTQELYAAHPFVLQRTSGMERGRGIQHLCARSVGIFNSFITFSDPTICDKMWEMGTESQTVLRATTQDIAAWLEKYFERGSSVMVIPGEGQVLMACMRICELLAVENMVRKPLMDMLAAPLSRLLCSDSEIFQGCWVAGGDAIRQHKTDGLRVAYTDSVQYQMTTCARVAAHLLGTADSVEAADALALAQERFVMLYRLLGNLHSYYEETCDLEQKDHFHRLMTEDLRARHVSLRQLENVSKNLRLLTEMALNVRKAQTDLKLTEEVLAEDEVRLVDELKGHVLDVVAELAAAEEERMMNGE